MGMKRFAPYTPSRRYMVVSDNAELGVLPGISQGPEKSLLRSKLGSGGRNNLGRETNINIGGGHKRRYRVIDFRRDKLGVAGKVVALEYDPNRTARIARVHYTDGEKRYILAPVGMQLGQTVMAGPEAEIKPGNALPLKAIPVGENIHNLELNKGRGGQICRSAGGAASLIAKEGEYAQVRLPSGEVRKVLIDCYASIGQIGNIDHQNIVIGKAGRSRWLGIRPHNRGTSKNPVDHPLGGGEGKSKGGRHPCSPKGLLAKGLKTRKNKRTSKFIVRKRSHKG